MTVLSTENGEVITTETGFALSIETAKTNGDVQLFDFNVDLLKSVLWQYNEAENLLRMLQSKSDWYDQNQKAFWENWYRDVFDLRTANQFGLIIWGIILGLQLYVNTPPDLTKPTFGFAGSGGTNFDNGNFTDTTGSSYLLPVDIQRRALQLRYLQLTSSGTVPETNRAMKRIFGDLGRVYLRDYGNMTQAYIFLFPIPADLKYLFDNYDILPRPAGVLSNYVDATINHFGFAPFGLNFDNGNFGS